MRASRAIEFYCILLDHDNFFDKLSNFLQNFIEKILHIIIYHVMPCDYPILEQLVSSRWPIT